MAARHARPVQSKPYKEFCARNSEWLKPYAVFCFLRDLFGTAEHWKWGVFSSPTPEVRRRAARRNRGKRPATPVWQPGSRCGRFGRPQCLLAPFSCAELAEAAFHLCAAAHAAGH